MPHFLNQLESDAVGNPCEGNYSRLIRDGGNNLSAVGNASLTNTRQGGIQ